RREPLSDRPLFWHLPHYTNQGSRPSGAVREGNWKLIEHYEDGSVELFNLDTDLGERTNLAATDPAQAKVLQAKLANSRKQVGAQENAVNPAFKPALHKAVYVDVDPSRYDPPGATAEERKRIQDWRRQMNAVVASP